MSTWDRLAEAVGIETEANWDKVAKQRNMQRYGSADRRDKLGPMAYFNTRGTGLAQGGMRPPIAPDPSIRRNGGPMIPQGTDRPGQGNPLMSPTRATGPSPLGTAPNSPGGRGRDWLDALAGDGEEDESAGY